MAGLRKRTWKTKKGITSRWEFSYMKDGKQCKKTFLKKPTPEEMAEISKTKISNPKIKDFVFDYINNNCRLHCKESTIETYNNYYNVAIKPLYNYKIKDLQRRDIEKFIIGLKEEKSPKTINNLLVFIKAFLNYAVESKIISESPANKIKQLPLEKQPLKTLTDEEVQCFLNCLNDKPSWVKAFFSILYYMGIRISECVALEWSDIDFENGVIHINKQYYRYRLTSTKNYETRSPEMPNVLKEILLEYKKTQYEENDLVFSHNGKYISVNNVRERHFKNIINEVESKLDVELGEITPHCLRHTHASYLLSNGVPLIYVSKRLGHKDCKTTLNVYNHVMQSDSTKALNLLNKIKQSEIRAKNPKSQQTQWRGVRVV